MGVPKNSLNAGQTVLNGMIDFAGHVIKPFWSLAGKQLRNGGPGSNDLMNTCKEVADSLAKMKKNL